MRHGSLFSGIGGFDLAAEWMGWEYVFHCEWNPFGQKILTYYWPKAISYDDITKTDFSIHKGTIDILTGGFPCQPYSLAGKRKGKEDERHLWPEMLRAIKELQPRWVVGENVFGLINWDGGLVFNEVQSDLEVAGYEVWPYVLPAASVNAPHKRERVWFIAYSRNYGHNGTENRQSNHKGIDGDQAGPEPVEQSKRCCSETTGEATSNTYCNGQQQCNSANEVNAGERWKHAQCNSCQSSIYGLITDSKSNGDRGKLRGLETENGSERETEKHWQNNMQFGNNGQERDATNTNGQRLRRESNRSGKPRQPYEKGSPANWRNFPTQSPVCDGDDGLPTELDGITFSKWRNESIKAGGNAIVPEVVHQIFQAIEAYEKL